MRVAPYVPKLAPFPQVGSAAARFIGAPQKFPFNDMRGLARMDHELVEGALVCRSETMLGMFHVKPCTHANRLRSPGLHQHPTTSHRPTRDMARSALGRCSAR